MNNIKKTIIFARNIRINALKMVASSNSPHIGSCLSIADILAVLFSSILKHNPKIKNYPKRDKFILSKGHAAAIYYAALAESGYFNLKLLKKFCTNGSNLFGHVTKNNIPGVEFSTGSLGHGISVACGMALSFKLKKLNNKVYCIISDGECNEGTVWEAALFASHHQLNNLTVIVDYNKIQSFGRVSEVMKLNPLSKKWKSFNWLVDEIDGHSHSKLFKSLSKKSNKKPKVIIANTIKGKGVSFMENKLLWHYKSPNDKELQIAIKNLF